MNRKFFSGKRYVHDTAKDLAIEVVKVQFQDDKRSKLLIRWINIHSKNVVVFPGQRADGTARVEIQSKDYQYWNLFGNS
jgi:hypothetical protein